MPSGMSIPRVSPQEAAALLAQGYTYVDVRSVGEWEEAHPEGSVNVPVMHAGPGGMSPNPEFVAVMEKLFPKDAKLVLGCRSGVRSLKAADLLLAAGYANLVDQRAGFDGPKDPFGQVAEPGWGRVGLPVAKGDAGGTSWAAAKAK